MQDAMRISNQRKLYYINAAMMDMPFLLLSCASNAVRKQISASNRTSAASLPRCSQETWGKPESILSHIRSLEVCTSAWFFALKGVCLNFDLLTPWVTAPCPALGRPYLQERELGHAQQQVRPSRRASAQTFLSPCVALSFSFSPSLSLSLSLSLSTRVGAKGSIQALTRASLRTYG